MPLKRASAEEKETRRLEKERTREAKAREKLKRDFFASPPGLARTAFEEGKQVFQYELDVQHVQAVVVAMSSATGKRTRSSDPAEILSAVCDEGWELVNGSFVFLQTGASSRSKFLSSGEQVAVTGTTVGYYLFKRNEANLRKDRVDPWEITTVPEEEMVGVDG